MYTVKDVAERLRMNPHTIRFYTDHDLIPGLKRDKNNVRLFDEDSVAWLLGVKNLRDSGMSLESIKSYIELCLIGDESLPERIEIVRQQRENIENQLKDLMRCAKYLDNKLALYQKLISGEISIDVTNPNQWDKNSNDDGAFDIRNQCSVNSL